MMVAINLINCVLYKAGSRFWFSPDSGDIYRTGISLMRDYRFSSFSPGYIYIKCVLLKHV